MSHRKLYRVFHRASGSWHAFIVPESQNALLAPHMYTFSSLFRGLWDGAKMQETTVRGTWTFLLEFRVPTWCWFIRIGLLLEQFVALITLERVFRYASTKKQLFLDWLCSWAISRVLSFGIYSEDEVFRVTTIFFGCHLLLFQALTRRGWRFLPGSHSRSRWDAHTMSASFLSKSCMHVPWLGDLIDLRLVKQWTLILQNDPLGIAGTVRHLSFIP